MKAKEWKPVPVVGIVKRRLILLLSLLAASSMMCDALRPSATPDVSPAKSTGPIYEGIYKPVGFVNRGTINATVMPCTWIPSGSQEQAPAPGASTVSTHQGAPGLWPNPSRFLSLPLGTYTWCIQYDEGDQDGDGIIDYFYFIDDRPTTITENDSDDHELARQVDFTAPPGPGTQIFPGTCPEAPQCKDVGGPRAIFVTTASGRDFAGGEELQDVEYDAASVSVFIDPALISWIAWNNAPTVSLTREARPGETFLGPGGFGTDDYISLTVVNPNGEALTVDLDQNDMYGRWEGPQNIIYGTSEAAPDVLRQYPEFANPPRQEFFIDEAGSHSAVFTVAGEYIFQFSFRNKYSNSASHGDIYILLSN